MRSISSTQADKSTLRSRFGGRDICEQLNTIHTLHVDGVAMIFDVELSRGARDTLRVFVGASTTMGYCLG